MKILLVTPMPPRPQAPGAIPVVLYAELIGLMEHNEVRLLTIAGREPGEVEAIDHLKSLGVLVSSLQCKEPRGLEKWQRRWRFASTWLAGKYPWRIIWYWDPVFQNKLDRALATESYDLVIIEDNALGIYSYRTSTPILYTEHEVRRPRSIDWSALMRKNPFRWLLNEMDWARWRRYQINTWQQFDRIQTFTEKDAGSVCALAPDVVAKVRVNPFGIVLTTVADPARQIDNNILFVGNFTHPPNVDGAMWLGREIMPLLRQLSPGISLNLVGIYPPAEVRSLATDDIHIHGPVTDIEPYFEEAAVVVAPLRIGGGMRMKVLHSMAMGKAVVSSIRGAEGFTFNKAQPPLVIAESTEEFARAVADLVASRQKRVRLGMQARRFVEIHFSARAYARRIEAISMEMIRDLQTSKKESQSI